jgi:hypothetical protein
VFLSLSSLCVDFWDLLILITLRGPSEFFCPGVQGESDELPPIDIPVQRLGCIGKRYSGEVAQ